MWPITHTSAKQLMPVANKPVLFYGLEAIRDAGITDVGLVVDGNAREIPATVGDGSAFGLDVSYIRQDAPLGLAHAVLIAREFLGDDDFVMYLGDNFIADGIAALVDEFRASKPDAQIILAPVADPREFGVAVLDEFGRVIGLEEKPRRPKSNLALVGVYMFTSCVHEAVRRLKPSRRGELEITEAIQWLIDSDRKVACTTISGYWRDTGNFADMLEVNRLVLETIEPRQDGVVHPGCDLIGRVVIESGAEITASRIVGPAIIGARTRIANSFIGPFTSVAEDCAVADSEIAYSILLRGASVRGAGRIEASIIGREVEVTPAPRVPKVHRLILGDHSKVQLSS
jgi:glucose-1-phosphate thymidylyltransferase